ncbi:MAG: hypothetical protein ACK5X3_13900, partial [Pseudomonadota bacterium]
MTPRTLKLNAHQTLTYYTPEDVEAMLASARHCREEEYRQRELWRHKAEKLEEVMQRIADRPVPRTDDAAEVRRWYAKDEADARIRHYQDEALCAEEAAMSHAQRVKELEAERDGRRVECDGWSRERDEAVAERDA